MRAPVKGWIAAALLAAAGEAPAQQHAFARCDHFQAQALANEVERLQESLALGADIECRQPKEIFDGATALELAAGAGAVDAVRVLLKRGAQVNARDASGWTALRHARQRYDAFVKAGANPLRFELTMEVLKQAGGTE